MQVWGWECRKKSHHQKQDIWWCSTWKHLPPSHAELSQRHTPRPPTSSVPTASFQNTPPSQGARQPIMQPLLSSLLWPQAPAHQSSSFTPSSCRLALLWMFNPSSSWSFVLHPLSSSRSWQVINRSKKKSHHWSCIWNFRIASCSSWWHTAQQSDLSNEEY